MVRVTCIMQSYNDIFAGDPTWVTLNPWRTPQRRTYQKVTKTSFRFLQTLWEATSAFTGTEPDCGVEPDLPEGFKEFCAKVSIDTSSIQYENDDLMREVRRVGTTTRNRMLRILSGNRKTNQFVGARCNLAKALLLATSTADVAKTPVR